MQESHRHEATYRLKYMPWLIQIHPLVKRKRTEIILSKMYEFLRKPSVLSELERSAEATIMFSTCVARAAKTVAEAARVAEPAFCAMPFQSTAGALP